MLLISRKEFSKNMTTYHIIKKHELDDTYKYIYDDKYFYKSIEMEGKDKELYYINSRYDFIHDDFINRNGLENNILIKENNPDLFDFINKSIHHLNEYYYTDNIEKIKIAKSYEEKTKEMYEVDKIEFEKDDLNFGLKYYDYREDMTELNELDEKNEYELILKNSIAYDRNKHFISYTKNKYYLSSLFPTNKFNYYKVNEDINDEETNLLLLKTGFMQINNINIPNKAVKELNYFINDYIYPIFMCRWLKDNGGTFNIINCCYSEFNQEINFNKIECDEKHYNKIIGCMSINDNKSRYSIKCNSRQEAEDLKYHNSNVRYFDEENNIVIFEEIKEQTINRGHISSFILGYATLEILDKLINIDYKNILGVRCDCIILNKEYNIFELSQENGGYKIEEKVNKIMYDEYNYINKKHVFNKTFEIPLTHLKLQYKKINLISGMAGSGKTSRFYKKFEIDERISDYLFLMPTNALLSKFKKENDGENIKVMTYQMLLKNFERGAHQNIKYTNVVLDEATMCDKVSMTLLLDIMTKTNTTFFIVGDYDFNKKVSYQLKPIQGDEFFNSFDKYDKDTIFYHNLTINYRQKNDSVFSDYLQSIRGKSNEYVMKTLIDKKFKKIDYDDMLRDYTIKDIIISPFENGSENEKLNSSYINKLIYDKTDGKEYIKCSYNATTDQGGAKNEFVNIIKNDIDFTKVCISCCNTSHIVQGLEFYNMIYILNFKYFTPNQLYVMLSRAKNIKQLRIINFL
jgi:hypothetical protein